MAPKKGKGKKKLVVIGDNEVTNSVANKLLLNITQDSQEGDTSVNEMQESVETPREGEDMKEEENGDESFKSAGKANTDSFEMLKELNDEDQKLAK